MYDIEQDDGDKHGQRVQTVLVCLMAWDGTVEAFGVLGDAEEDA